MRGITSCRRFAPFSVRGAREAAFRGLIFGGSSVGPLCVNNPILELKDWLGY